MRFDENQPDEFFPFISRYMSVGGQYHCDCVLPEADGALEFRLCKGDRRIVVHWNVTRAPDGSVKFRDGGIRACGGGKDDRTASVGQIVTRLKALCARRTPLLLEKRNREIVDVSLNTEMVKNLFAEVLVPEKTRRYGYLFTNTILDGNILRFIFCGPERKLVFALGPAGCDADGKLISRPGPFVLFSTHDERDSEEEKRVGQFLSYILELGTHDRMRIVEPGDAPAASGDDGNDNHNNNLQARLYDSWAANPFFLDEPLEWVNKFNALFACEGRIVLITDCDRECNLYFQYHDGPVEYFNLAPWNIQPDRKMALSMRSTDAAETDAIMTGCEDRMRSLILDEAAREHPQLVAVIDSCMSKLIGDSVSRVIAGLSPELGGIPVLDLTMGTQEMWAQLIEHFQIQREPPSDASVNLVGFGYERTRGLTELRRLLQAAGIRTNTSFIPSFNINELRGFGNAARNVLYPAPMVHYYFNKAKPLCAAPVIEPASPYGVAGTRDWLNSIRREFDMEPVTDAWVETAAGPVAGQWRELTRMAGEYRVSVVLMSDHFKTVDMPETRLGVPWLACLSEMGFGIDLIVLDTQTNTHYTDGVLADFDELRRNFHNPGAHNIVSATSEMELHEILNGCDSTLVYTEAFHDRRVTSAGKTPFSIMAFEMGFAGALRTLERLLGYCRSPFYRRYKNHLKHEPVSRLFEKKETA